MWSWMKSHKYLGFGLIVVAFGLWFFFGRGKQVEYSEFTVSQSRVEDTLELSGKVSAERSAMLRFAAGGLVTYMGAKEGDSVKKWQTLASVDTRQVQKVLEQKLNLYSIQRGTFDQTIDDNDNSIPSGELGLTLERLLQKNQYQLDNTVKDVEYQDLTLKLSRLSSPLAGILTQSPINTAGVQVGATDTWVVVDPTSLYFSADLDETDLSRVKLGQKVRVSLDAYPGQDAETTIQSISYGPKETSAGTTYEVKVTLPAEFMHDLRLGLNGTATIILSEKDNVLTLPASAITSRNGESYVSIKSGAKYIEKKIDIGIENNGVVEIKSGVSEGDHVYIEK